MPHRQHRHHASKKFRPLHTLRWSLSLCLVAMLAVFMLNREISIMSRELPSVSGLWSSFSSTAPSLVYDREGKIIATLGAQSSTNVPLKDIAPAMPEALLAIEDHHFYHNHGYDLKSIARALYVDLRAGGRPVEGASTITEQLAKNLYLSDKKSLSRKLDEFLLGRQLYRHYSKAQILDMYLNTVYFGQGAKGISAAAKIYFNTTPAHLTLSEAILLAGLPQEPSQDDPYIHPKEAKMRQREVVKAMVRYHHLKVAQAAEIERSPIRLHPPDAASEEKAYPYPWYLDAVVRALLEKGFSLDQILHGGLHIETALRPRVYDAAQAEVQYWMNRNFGLPTHAYPDHQAAVVVENPHDGHIWAIIGGRQYLGFLSPDLAVQALRSTGSAIKPVLDYGPALVRGYTAQSVLQDVPLYRHVHHQAFWPQNDNRLYRGYLSLIDALAVSNNNLAVHLFAREGPTYALRYANQQFGMHLSQANQPSPPLELALGVDTNLMRLTEAYGAIDNGGIRISPILVMRVTKGHRTLYQTRVERRRALPADDAFILTQMMKRVLQPTPIPNIGPDALPTGAHLGLHRSAAAKSGTSTEEADAWFLGFEPQMLVGVWEGNRIGELPQPYTNSGAGPAYGAIAAGPIWKGIMSTVNRTLQLPKESFPIPRGVIYERHISTTSGLRMSPYTPRRDVTGGWYQKGTAPDRIDNTWYTVKVSRAHPHQLWMPGCDAFVVHTVLRPESDWHPGLPKPWDSRYWPPTKTCARSPASPSE